jgi:hypothetical protein
MEEICISNKKRNKVVPGSEARLVYSSKNKDPLILETNECWSQITGGIITIYFTEKEVNIFNRICELAEIPQVWEDPEEPFYNFVFKNDSNLQEFDGIFTIEIKGVWYTDNGTGISAKLLKYEVTKDYSESFDSDVLDEIIPADID